MRPWLVWLCAVTVVASASILSLLSSALVARAQDPGGSQNVYLPLMYGPPPPVATATSEPTATPPVSSAQFQLVEMRRLTPCENLGKHQIFIRVVDENNQPLDGISLVQVPAGSTGPVLDRTVSGTKGPGLAEFVMWKNSYYAVYVVENTYSSEPADTDIAQPLHSSFTDEEACATADGGNTLYHNSFAVTFRRAFDGVRPTPTNTPAPAYPWMLVPGSVQPAPNCGTVYFSGHVEYTDGSRMNGVCIYLGYYGPRGIKYSGGGGAGAGNWSFTPCGANNCTGPVEIYVVGCPPDMPAAGLTLDPNSPPPDPASDKFTVNITNRCETGQWTNIIFRESAAGASDPGASATPTPLPTEIPVSTPTPELSEREWDPDLDLRGAVLVPAQVQPGQGYWRLVKGVWYDGSEPGYQGKQHIFVDVQDTASARLIGVPVRFGSDNGLEVYQTVNSQPKPGEPYGLDFFMSAPAPAYRAQIADGQPSDIVKGLGLGNLEYPNGYAQASYGFVWRWVPGNTQTGEEKTARYPRLVE